MKKTFFICLLLTIVVSTTNAASVVETSKLGFNQKLNTSSNNYFDYQGFTLEVNDEFAFFDASLWTYDFSTFEHNIVWFNGPNNFEYVTNEKGLSKMRIHILKEPGLWERDYTSGQIISKKEYFYTHN